MGWTYRLAGNLRAAAALHHADVTLPSLVMFPIRRRFGRRENRLEVQDGTVLFSPAAEPLVTLFRETWVSHRYCEPQFTAQPRHAIVDIGANVGVFTVWAARRNPQAVVLAVEPAPETCSLLRRNVEVNRLANIRIVQAACAAQSAGRRQLYGRGDTALTTLYDRDLLGSRFRSVAEVDAVTLEGLFAAETVEKCDLLKLDCEGAEYEILLNAPPKILQRVSRIALEYHLGMNSHDPAELSAFLRAQGFTVTCEPPLDAESGYLYAARQTAGMMSSRVSA